MGFKPREYGVGRVGKSGMSNGTSWTLLYKHDGDIPQQFCDVRRVGASVFSNRGSVSTWGEMHVVSANSLKQATDAFDKIVEQCTHEGFVVTRKGECDPSGFDFDELTQEIADGARRVFTRMRELHSEETIDGYALYSDEDAMTIVPVVDSKETRLANHDGDNYVRWSPQEWSLRDGGEHLDIAYRRILMFHHDWSLEAPEGFEERVFEACVKALEKLEEEKFFGTGSERENVFVTFEEAPGEDPIEAIRRLNPDSVYKRYIAWRESEC